MIPIQCLQHHEQISIRIIFWFEWRWSVRLAGLAKTETKFVLWLRFSHLWEQADGNVVHRGWHIVNQEIFAPVWGFQDGKKEKIAEPHQVEKRRRRERVQTSSLASPHNLCLGDRGAARCGPKIDHTVKILVNGKVLALLDENAETADLSRLLRKVEQEKGAENREKKKNKENKVENLQKSRWFRWHRKEGVHPLIADFIIAGCEGKCSFVVWSGLEAVDKRMCMWSLKAAVFAKGPRIFYQHFLLNMDSSRLRSEKVFRLMIPLGFEDSVSSK